MANLDFLENLGVLANLAQIYDIYLDFTEINNDELMKMLIHQNQNYLEIIMKQNEKIIELLGGKNG